ncbi:NAD(P)/FAD-dependent oxidoreductase [Candidatus Uabimicrobium sp. HlEnr_7]|uniref:NAD(P)/FAD-dependent oxidoreductase n=1 Tax=Candidatus Uabimicrobium helgolandensis TaxID=3095367 RepID=UPI0035585865
MEHKQIQFDVAILGSGFGGSVLAMILAKQGAKVVIIDAKSHPRFAIGESTVPLTSQFFSLLSRKYEIPELANFGLNSPAGIQKIVGNCCGIKRIFGFTYHQFDKNYNSNNDIQFGNVWRDENHLFRQEVDTHLAKIAVNYGAVLKEDTPVISVEINEQVKITANNGEEICAKYIVDGSGYRSLLAEKFTLRDATPKPKHHSRCIFTHMQGVLPFEKNENLSIPWCQGTLHHLFESGWIWVIPFGNHPQATNNLTSVGLTLDSKKFPDLNLSGEEEFQSILQKIPIVARQFAKATAVRPWIKTGRLQYSSHATVGHRYCLLPHAAGFVDALFSRGFSSTLETIDVIAETLLESLAEDDFSMQRFEHIDALQHKILDFTDRIVHCAFISWANFDLWNAWMRVWAIGVGTTESNLGSYLFMGKRSKWQPVHDPITSRFEDPGFRSLFEDCETFIIDFKNNKISATEASTQLFQRIANYDFQMTLPEQVCGHEWAMKNALCRDLFLGKPDLHKRWKAKQPDPHLV